MHICDCMLFARYLKELSQFIVWLLFRIEVHACQFLQFLPRLVLLLFLIHWLFSAFLEKGGLIGFNLALLRFILFAEFLHNFAFLSHLLFIQVQVVEVNCCISEALLSKSLFFLSIPHLLFHAYFPLRWLQPLLRSLLLRVCIAILVYINGLLVTIFWIRH